MTTLLSLSQIRNAYKFSARQLTYRNYFGCPEIHSYENKKELYVKDEILAWFASHGGAKALRDKMTLHYRQLDQDRKIDDDAYMTLDDIKKILGVPVHQKLNRQQLTAFPVCHNIGWKRLYKKTAFELFLNKNGGLDKVRELVVSDYIADPEKGLKEWRPVIKNPDFKLSELPAKTIVGETLSNLLIRNAGRTIDRLSTVLA